MECEVCHIESDQGTMFRFIGGNQIKHTEAIPNGTGYTKKVTFAYGDFSPIEVWVCKRCVYLNKYKMYVVPVIVIIFLLFFTIFFNGVAFDMAKELNAESYYPFYDRSNDIVNYFFILLAAAFDIFSLLILYGFLNLYVLKRDIMKISGLVDVFRNIAIKRCGKKYIWSEKVFRKKFPESVDILSSK